MSSELYKMVNYKSEIPFIIGNYIHEYDLSKANINILRQANCLTDTEYTNLYNASRELRQKSIGLMLRHIPNLSNILCMGIIEAKKNFFEANNIQDEDVLSIKNDAVFIIGKSAQHTQFGTYVKFANKNNYTSYYNIPVNNIEIYYYMDVTGLVSLDIKGIRDEKLLLHQEYIIGFLVSLFALAEEGNYNNTIKMLTNFYIEYIELKLDAGFYRRLDSDSDYVLKRMSDISSFRAEFIENKNKDSIDISYNANILRYFIGIYSQFIHI